MMISFLRRMRHGPLKSLSPAWVSAGRLYRRLVREMNLTVNQMIGPYGPFRLNAHFAFSNFVNWGKGHNDCFNACVEACRGKRCVIDVGAHIGLLSLPMASVLHPEGHLIAFEPAAVNRTYLERHLQLNSLEQKVTVEVALVGADEREDILFFEMDADCGMNSIVRGAAHGAYSASRKRQVTLDRYCAERDLLPEVIKIDVEGAELGVLRGAQFVLERCRPLIFLSVHPRQIGLLGESLSGLSDLISSLGYVCRHADGTPVASFAFREYILFPVEVQPCLSLQILS